MACTNKATKNPNLVFSSIILPSKLSEINAMLLMHSIRSFAGSLSQNPIWCFFPENNDKISQNCKKRLDELDVKLIPFEIEKQDLEFPFVSLAYSSAKAESIAQGSIEIIAWLNPNTVVLNEPIDFKEQMAEARRRQILMGAAQVFAEKGFHKATTKQIAKAGGVSEGTIYNYFKNKRELLVAMIDSSTSKVSFAEMSKPLFAPR